ncbi:hypothetical protein PUN28_019382 [Cardiocondyla obscurior]|uniref:Uncharacterized protein n=1 Tax=Cardiocondyla obscurior TaxID=286306 RepID=A0AAW2EC17_9HYME
MTAQLSTYLASMRFFSGVNSFVLDFLMRSSEPASAMLTLIRFLTVSGFRHYVIIASAAVDGIVVASILVETKPEICGVGGREDTSSTHPYAGSCVRLYTTRTEFFLQSIKKK